ncbi:MAG: aldose 1-epimerase family protein [Ferruginibacter sp.]|nr:aldose 1-epimerase family protein [Ferruginibacter sp.]
MHIIENDFIRVVINEAGAELNSLFNKVTGLEYLWSGDAAFWPKKSPVLFPIIGLLKDNRYYFDNKSYELGRHGFAREKIFSVTEAAPSAICFELQNDESTLNVYPFPFSFSIKYTIEESRLTVTYLVKNTGVERMYFSVGAHPAFKLPVADELAYDDYYLLFNKTENAGRWPISADGLIETAALPLLNDTNQLRLSKQLFYKDAIVLKTLQSDEVQLKSDKHPSGLTFSFKGFPYLGIWAARDADFVCIEPWCGVADSVNANQLLTDKEGINDLAAGEDFERAWTVTTW